MTYVKTWSSVSTGSSSIESIEIRNNSRVLASQPPYRDLPQINLVIDPTLPNPFAGASNTAGPSSTSPVPPGNGSSGLTRQARIAIGVTIPLVVIFAALLVFFCLRRRRRRVVEAASQLPDSQTWNKPELDATVYHPPVPAAYPRAELSAGELMIPELQERR